VALIDLDGSGIHTVIRELVAAACGGEFSCAGWLFPGPPAFFGSWPRLARDCYSIRRSTSAGIMPFGEEFRTVRSNWRPGSARCSSPRATTPPKTFQTPRGPQSTEQPRYPRAGATGGVCAEGRNFFQIFSSCLNSVLLRRHDGSGRPEKIAAVAVQRSIDFDVPMHDHHEGAENRVPAAIRSAGIPDQVVAVVDVPDRSSARLV
jgi:hypothetical protein